MDSEELSEWILYDGIYPPPDPHLHTGMIVASLANLLSSGKKRWKATHFMPKRKAAVDGSPEKDRAEKAFLDRFFGVFKSRKAE